MYRPRFEKFEMKYGYCFPEDFKKFMIKFGGDVQFGSCSFEYPDNIINNLIRIPGDMDFHLTPFGDVGNGDYYCFYRYGFKVDEIFLGIWLHETRNFVILASNFRSFMYKCLLDDYLSTVMPSDGLSDSEYREAVDESLSRCIVLCEEFNFDFEKVKSMKNEFDYHRLMVEHDPKAIQSLCYLGKSLVKKRDIRGFDLLEAAKSAVPFYTAPYYIMGKIYIGLGKDNRDFYREALKTSLISTGYSYWQEDFLDVPDDIHREIALFLDSYLEGSDSYLERELFNGRDPYDYELRYEAAKEYSINKDYEKAIQEYNNALYCCDNKSAAKEILKEALRDVKSSGYHYLSGIIENDIKKLDRMISKK